MPLKSIVKACLLSGFATAFSTSSLTAENLTVPGTGDGIVVLQAVAKAFNQAHPEHNVTIPPSIGSSGGAKAVGKGHAPLGRVARPLKDKEKPYGLTYTPIFSFPIVFAVNEGVAVDGLTSAQVTAIYDGTATNWNEVGGNDAKIRVVRREDGDSSMKVLKKHFPVLPISY